jgi:hypothetical protein
MTPKTTSSATPNSPNWAELLSNPDLLVPVLRLLDSPQWEGLCRLLQAERLSHLERLADPSIENEKFIGHRAIANWLASFADYTSGVRAFVKQELNAKDEPPMVGSPFMMPDSDLVEYDS